jgi:hypothetical protein
MKWYIIALLYLQPNVEPHVVVNSDFIFKSYEICQEFMVKEQWNLRDTLIKVYPQLDSHEKHYSMRCVSEEGALEIYKNLKNKGQDI